MCRILIMEEDLLGEAYLPRLDLNRIQSTDPENAARLSGCVEEKNECFGKRKPMSPKLKDEMESAIPDFAEVPISLENMKIIRRDFILTNLNDKPLENNFKSLHLSSTNESTIVANNLVKDINDEDTDGKKYLEITSVALKCVRDSKALPNESNCDVVASRKTKSNGHSRISENKSEVEILFRESLNKSSDTDSERTISAQNSSCFSSAESSSESIILLDVDEQPESTCEVESEPALCVISEVIGNAVSEFSGVCETQENVKEASETQLITPKKTNDITKIKGWRRKQFFVEKPTTVEFYSIANEKLLKKRIELTENEMMWANPEDTGNVENAFVCDTLDEFLNEQAELKIGFEIPHLFAEFGIKLTSDEVVSKPNVSNKDFKEIETRYCVSVPLPVCEVINFDEVKEENFKRVKRPIENDIKPTKMLKLDINKRQSVRFPQKPMEKIKSELKDSINDVHDSESNFKAVCSSNKNYNNIKLVNKLIALVVYPGPFMPLHPIVQYHLNKIRSYRTIVDKNWANFAASAFFVKNQRYKRSILPAYCCVKIESNPTIKSDKDKKNNLEEIDSISLTSKVNDNDKTENEICKTKKIELKNCSVVIEKLKSSTKRDPWCLEHNCYNCEECGLNKSKFNECSMQKSFKKVKSVKEEPGERVIVSPRASFDKKVASLLAKKVRLLKFNGDTLTSIDCLKTVTPNTVEFIKLKFVKESFLAGYISIWYLKPESPMVRSRAFLTFSQTPPVPNAINLKSNAYSLENLPEVITEIVSVENTFYSNEYAILHCDGEIWEIHGSLNIAFGKCDKNVEQIFTSVELPELKKLEEIAYEILNVRAVKWWIVDLTQRFRLIEIRSGNYSAVATRKKFIETIRLNLFGFMHLKKDSENRVLGAYIAQRLLPFILIGPYYLLETHNLILKTDSSNSAFMYYGEEKVTTNYPLKLFINSVIKNLEKNDKKLEGLWLYDKMCLDSTSYLEVVTTNLGDPVPNKYSSIDIEHGYSLSSLTNCSISGATSGIIKRRDGKEEFKNITVYLYFDIFELGFVEGELQFDNSVIISHPLDHHTKMKSHKIGDWFIGIIRRRIQFFPKELSVKWLITKHKDDLRERRPFNKFFLSGAHILTRKGIYYLLEMSEPKIEKLGLDKNEISKAIAQCKVIKELSGLKTLAGLLVTDSNKTLSMGEVLTEAVSEIKKLQVLQEALEIKKFVAEKEKMNLAQLLIRKINFARIPFHTKLKLLRNIEKMFVNKNGKLNENFLEKLNSFGIGRKYLNFKKRFYEDLHRAREENNPETEHEEETKKISKLKPKKLRLVFNSCPKTSIPERNYLISMREMTLHDLPNKVIVKKEEPHSYSKLCLESEKLNITSDHLSFFKSECSAVFEELCVDKIGTEDVEEEKIKISESITQTNPKSKSDGFLKLTSPELPNNIKLSWKNWVPDKSETE